MLLKNEERLEKRIRTKKVFLLYSGLNLKDCTSVYLLKQLRKKFVKKQILQWSISRFLINEVICFHVLLILETSLDTVNAGYFDLWFNGSLVRPKIKPTGSLKKLVEHIGKGLDLIVSDNLNPIKKKKKSLSPNEKKSFRLSRKR
jgi:hypothetical protein